MRHRACFREILLFLLFLPFRFFSFFCYPYRTAGLRIMLHDECIYFSSGGRVSGKERLSHAIEVRYDWISAVLWSVIDQGLNWVSRHAVVERGSELRARQTAEGRRMQRELFSFSKLDRLVLSHTESACWGLVCLTCMILGDIVFFHAFRTHLIPFGDVR